MSYKPSVFVDGQWCENALAFATEEEALVSARDLESRWLKVEDSRAIKSDQPVSHSLTKLMNGMWEFKAVHPQLKEAA